MEVKKAGILTGGGDAPGLNGVIRGATVTLDRAGVELVGFLEGWRGALENNTMILKPEDVREILSTGGTVLGASRTNPYKNPDRDIPKILDTLKALGLDALIAVGGDDTLGVADRLHKDHGVHIVGVPKTIDNDLCGTDVTFGFYTAVQRATEAVDNLVTTARSHRRCLVVEVMGRHAGWIAAYAGMAGSADYVLVPEEDVNLEDLATALKRVKESGKEYSMVVVSEGAKIAEEEVLQTKEKDAFGHVRLGGIARTLAKIIEKTTGWETRHVTLGHLQRGGTPCAYDRILSTRYGVKAAQMVLSSEWGFMASLQGDQIVSVPLAVAAGDTRTLDAEMWQLAKSFFA